MSLLTILHILIVLATLGIGYVWFVSVKALVAAKKDNWIHHEYVGFAFVLWGLFFGPLGLAACALGLWIMADDAYQHWLQTHGQPTYLSPIHRWLELLAAKWKWLGEVYEKI